MYVTLQAELIVVEAGTVLAFTSDFKCEPPISPASIPLLSDEEMMHTSLHVFLSLADNLISLKLICFFDLRAFRQVLCPPMFPAILNWLCMCNATVVFYLTSCLVYKGLNMNYI